MANRYVNSAATGANNGTSWTDAWTSLSSASAAAAGDTVYVRNTHYEALSVATTNLTIGGSKTNLVRVISVDEGLNATVGARFRPGAGNTLNVSGPGVYYWGIDFSAEAYGINSFAGTQDHLVILEKCRYGNSTGAGQAVHLGGYNTGGNECYLIDSEFVAGGNSFFVLRASRIKIIGGFGSGGRASTCMFQVGVGYTPGGDIEIDGFDMSAIMPISGPMFLMGSSNIKPGKVSVSRCKLVSGWTGVLCTDATLAVTMDACDDGTSTLRTQNYSPTAGGTYSETAVTRTGGATVNGTGFSFRLASASTAQEVKPLETRTLARPYPGSTAEETAWSAGATKTITVEVVTDGVTLTDQDAWLEVRSFDTAGSVKPTVKSNRRATPTAAPTNHPTSTATWSTPGLTSPVKQKLSVNISPQIKGYLTAKVMLAKPSTTMYVCPQVEVT